MTRTPKINSIITALETIEPTTFEQLCADLLRAGALRAKWKDNLIQMRGSNLVKNTTIPYPVDGIIDIPEGLCVLQCSTQEDWVSKLKDDVKSVKRWAEKQSRQLVGMIFITTRHIGNRGIGNRGEEKLLPEEFVKKELSQFNTQVEAYVFGKEDLLRVLRTTKYFGIRKEWLNIPKDYFLSLKSFKSCHRNQAQGRHIYLKTYVQGTGREESIKALENFVSQTDKRVLLIHSQGGIGKTRFVLEFLIKRVKERDENIDILFNQIKKHVDVDEVIYEISEDKKSLIVIDDAHLIDNLTDFSKILSDRSHAKLILITRSTASESVKRSIGYPAGEIELTPLEPDASIELLKGNLETPLRDEHLRYADHMCEGNPLLIGITAHLINKGEVQWYGVVKKNDLIRDYLKNILAELKQHNGLDRKIYEPYLALLFLLKPFSLSDDEIRSLIRDFVNIDVSQEGILLRDLEGCAVLEQHGDTLWPYPDLLGEYLVEETFFSDIPILNFDDIFLDIPSSNMKSVFKTLRELDSSKSRDFLRKWTGDLSDEIESQNNFELCDSLGLLEIIVSIVPDEALEIIDGLLRPESEKPPSTSEILGLATATREYRAVLHQCLRILGNHRLRYVHFDETLEKVLRVYFYKPESEEYPVLRKDALEAIAETAAYNLNVVEAGYGYSIQTRMFERVRAWKQENLEKNFTLILRVCGTLLGTEIKSQYSDYEGIGRESAPVIITDELISLRRDIISLLKSIFDEVLDSRQQVEVLGVLNCAISPSVMYDNETIGKMIRDNAKTIVNFYLVLANRIPPPEVEVIEEIEQQARHLKDWHQKDIEVVNTVNQLVSVLQSHAPYQLFKTLAGDDSLFWGEEEKSYKQLQTERDQKIKEIADGITHDNLGEWLEELDKIAIILSQNSDRSPSSFHQFLFEIGKNKPHFAQVLIDNTLREDNILKDFITEFIRGIRASTRPEIADSYVSQWLSGKNQMLLMEIPRTYWRVDEEFLGDKDVEIFANLLNCRRGDKEQQRRLNIHIMSNISWVYKKNPLQATEIICQLFRAADRNSIKDYVRELWWARKKIDLSQWELTKFKEILKKFEDLPALNNDALYILAQYGQKEPIGLVKFLERRVEKQMEHDSISRYEAIPYGPNLKQIADVYQVHAQHSEVINQIMKWFQNDDYRYKQAAADLISGIFPGLDGPLEETLLNLIRSGDPKDIHAVLKVLEEFPEDSVSDELYKEAVKNSKGERELQNKIEFSLVHRIRSYSGIRGRIAILRNLKARLASWLDDENRYVTGFAQRVLRNLEVGIEEEGKWASEEEIKRKKGLR